MGLNRPWLPGAEGHAAKIKMLIQTPPSGWSRRMEPLSREPAGPYHGQGRVGQSRAQRAHAATAGRGHAGGMSETTTTDLYEVTMAMSYLREGMRAPATFSLFVRDLPPGRGFLVAAGLEPALDYLSRFRITADDVRDFAHALHRPPEELAALLDLCFDGDVRAIPEGRLVFAGEPLMEVTAPLPQAQLVETYLLTQVCHQTAVASKASRCVIAAQGRSLVDFSLRRTHGPGAGLQAARLGALVGFSGTSNVAAATQLGIPASGTMAHSYVETFACEEDAFRAFARAHPGPLTLLVDTYDTEGGVATAAHVLADLRRARAARSVSTAATSAHSRTGHEPCSTRPGWRTYGSSRAAAWTSTPSPRSSASKLRSMSSRSGPAWAWQPTPRTWMRRTSWSNTTGNR